MPAPMDPTRCLALAPEGVFVAVTYIPFHALRLHCADRGLCEGDHVRVAGEAAAEVLLEKATGERLRLQRRYALMIEVRRVVEAADRVGARRAGWT